MDPRLVRAGCLVLLLVLLVQDRGAAHPARAGQEFPLRSKLSADGSEVPRRDASLAARAPGEEDDAHSTFQEIIRDRRTPPGPPRKNKRLSPGSGCFGNRLDRIGSTSGLGCGSGSSSSGTGTAGKK
uniref:Natriuretic-Vgla2 n=1 Tax=Varanus glauerti TaxID=169841 RepID=E2E4J2_VARGA|nr:natriuretic-Vgla2 [Varanus glauerti]